MESSRVVNIGAGEVESNASISRRDQESTSRFLFHWKGSVDCDSKERVLARIQELVSGPIESKLSDFLVVYAVVEAVSDGMRAQLTLLDRLGAHERLLEGATCQELVEATALVLALAINSASDEMTVRQENSPGRLNEAHSGNKEITSANAIDTVLIPEPATVRSSKAVVSVVSPLTSRRSNVLGGISSDARIGSFPGLTRGMGLNGAFERSWMSFSVNVGWLFSENSAAGNSGRASNFNAVLMTPRLCGFDTNSVFAVGPCVSTSLGMVRAKVVGVDRSTPISHAFESTGLGVTFRYLHRDSAFFALEVDGMVPWRRTKYVVDQDPIYRPNWVGGRFALNVGLAW
jgi:hypothetical protein